MRRLSYVLAAAFLSPQQITFCHVHIFTNHFHVLLTYEYLVLLLICKLKKPKDPSTYVRSTMLSANIRKEPAV